MGGERGLGGHSKIANGGKDAGSAVARRSQQDGCLIHVLLTLYFSQGATERPVLRCDYLFAQPHVAAGLLSQGTCS